MPVNRAQTSCKLIIVYKVHKVYKVYKVYRLTGHFLYGSLSIVKQEPKDTCYFMNLINFILYKLTWVILPCNFV